MKILIYSLLILTFGLIVVSLFAHFVPYNMDEFSLYHTLACHYYPNNLLNTFRVGCLEFDLMLPFTKVYLPLREYTYMGSLTSVYFTPIFLIWKNPESVRFMGIIFLALESILYSKLFNLKFKYIFIGLTVFFPYFFQHIVDTGVVGFQITLFLTSLLLIRTWVKKKNIIFPFLSFLLIFLGVWTKLTFIWFIPAFLILLAIEVLKDTNGYRKLLVQFTISVLVIASLFAYLFASQDRNGKLFLEEFFSDSRTRITSIKSFLLAFRPDWILSSPVIKAVINPYESTQRIYDPISKPLFSVFYDVFVFFLLPLIWVKSKNARSIIFYLLFWVTLLFIYRSGRSWSIHHAILAYPFLIMSFLSLAKSLNKKLLIFVIVIFVLLNSFLFLTFSKQKIPLANDFSAQIVNTELNNEELGNKYIYVIVDWGMYYFQSLYGPKNQTALYFEPLDSKNQIEEIKKIAKTENKNIIFVYNSADPKSSMQLINKSFKFKKNKITSKNSIWQLLIQE